MNALLDTHSFLWFIDDNPRLSVRAKSLIEDPVNERFLSVASQWEIAIKVSVGKLKLPLPFAAFIPAQLRVNSIAVLPITDTHLALVSAMPLHHRDPFDRLLVAQAIAEDMPIVSCDTMLDRYPVTRLW